MRQRWKDKSRIIAVTRIGLMVHAFKQQLTEAELSGVIDGMKRLLDEEREAA